MLPQKLLELYVFLEKLKQRYDFSDMERLNVLSDIHLGMFSDEIAKFSSSLA